MSDLESIAALYPPTQAEEFEHGELRRLKEEQALEVYRESLFLGISLYSGELPKDRVTFEAFSAYIEDMPGDDSFDTLIEDSRMEKRSRLLDFIDVYAHVQASGFRTRYREDIGIYDQYRQHISRFSDQQRSDMNIKTANILTDIIMVGKNFGSFGPIQIQEQELLPGLDIAAPKLT